ncbi:alpha-tubulin suppressor protein Aats1 [Eremomyces bilateralis CBS 781.70]|uniref:Alpha-tubulin suppressor protein Aats1 n=1 Tax=Eremomyces bilateralis CBS 781.70 TaxID=1392243 RepID=A0A6G1G586_9PEZI|nr:alpha-tubulin suppressor protein Aats1 [Eremomyces bilateralis CBS 781.70]KAF1812989.1 alpha-tubulin suppressor protein Aats1 [Eremomyces bilateralis CBS 781.70]
MPLFCLGSNGSGQLGLGHNDDISTPTIMPVPEGLSTTERVQIVAGGNHTILLTSTGQVFAAGTHDHGPTGVDISERKESSPVFVPVQLIKSGSLHPSPVNICAATWEASAFVLDNRVLTCGYGSKGELGQGAHRHTSPQPCEIEGFPPPGTSIIDISASMSHMVAVLSDGDVYGWGSGRKGQIGQPPIDKCWTPRKLSSIPFKAIRVVCGREFTYIVGSPDSGAHIILGNNKWNVISDAPPSITDWKDVGASWGSIYVLFRSGEMLSWGRNDHGQLCPNGLPRISMIATGSEHCMAVSTTNKVLAWGWGEHGNCGLPTAPNGDVQDRCNELEVQGVVVSLGAGCATSWIQVAE